MPSGVCHARVPPAIRALRPEGATMVLFPSRLCHRTFSFGSRDRRISIAFDVKAG